MSSLISSITSPIPTNVIPFTDSTTAGSLSSIEVISSPVVSISLLSTSIVVGTTQPPPTSTLISTSSALTSHSSINLTSSSGISIQSNSSSLLTPTSALVSSSAQTVATTVVTVDPSSTSTVTSSLPTSLISSPSNSVETVSRRTAIIAGTTTGVVALVLVILAGVFLYRRHKLRKVLEFSGKKREGRGLLDGEEFDDDERNISTSMQSYPSATHAVLPATSSTPNLMRSRISETGSIFREEVWPPPGFIDPISKQSSQVDLSGIVDDVMGPLISYEPISSSTSYPGSSPGHHETRHRTDTSTASAFSSTSTSSLISEQSYSDPFRSNFVPPIPSSSSFPTSVSASRMSDTISYPTPAPTASTRSLSPPAKALSRMSDTISYPNPAPISSTRSLSPPFRASRPNTLPRKSSPLASTGDAGLWLTRNVRASP